MISLYSTGATRQKVLDVGSHSFTEVSHGAKATAGCSVIQEPADACRVILF